MILAPTLLLNAGSGAIVRPTFSRDFAGEKTLNNGTGPAIAFTRASNATFFDANGTLQTATSDTPRFDHDPATAGNPSRGLLIEEARTNSLRNSQGGGSTAGVIGSGGALPTFWGANGIANDVSGEIVGTGTENGLAYVDIKISGTPSATASVTLRLENTNQVVAANGQTWTNSAYVKLQGGSLANTVVRIGVQGRDASGVLVSGETTQNDITPTGDGLAQQGYSVTRTMANAGVERAFPYLLLTYTSGDPIDLTLRIAAPQLEQGAFPTSYIPTTTVAVTRSADSAVVTPISSFYNQSEGTLFVESFVASLGQDFPTLLNVHNGTDDTDAVTGFINKSSGNIEYGTTGFSYGAASAAGTNKSAVALSATSARMAVNGTLSSVDDTSVTMTADKSAIRLGAKRNGSETLNGHIRRIAYWPKRLSNALLQSLTA